MLDSDTSHATLFRNTLISNNCHKNIGTGRGGAPGQGGVVIMSTSTSTQIPNQKTSKKPDITREQDSKQANITQGNCGNLLKKLQFACPAFKTPGISATVHHTNPYITLALPVESIFQTMNHQPIFPLNSLLLELSRLLLANSIDRSK